MTVQGVADIPKLKRRRNIKRPKKESTPPNCSLPGVSVMLIPIATIIQATMMKGRVLSMRYLRPSLSITKVAARVPITLKPASGMFRISAASSLERPLIYMPDFCMISGP